MTCQQERSECWTGGAGHIVMENVENFDIFMAGVFPLCVMDNISKRSFLWDGNNKLKKFLILMKFLIVTKERN